MSELSFRSLNSADLNLIDDMMPERVRGLVMNWVGIFHDTSDVLVDRLRTLNDSTTFLSFRSWSKTHDRE